jgi:hypothetical protein
MKWTISFVFAATLTASAQPIPPGGPTAGFVFDPIDHCIRPLVGYPGASYLSAPVLDQLSKGSIGPNGITAVVSKDGAVQIISDLRNAGTAVTIDSALSDWDQIAWATDAKTVVLYSAANAQAVVIRNLDSAPAADSPIVFSGPPGSLTALAISNGAAAMIAGISDPSDGGLFLVSAGTFTRLAYGKNFTGVTFDPSGQNAFAADRDALLVWQVSASTWSASAIADPTNGVTDPVGISLTNGGSTLVIANAQSSAVSVIDIASRNLLATVALDVPPVTVTPLAADIFFLTPRSSLDNPLFILQSLPQPAAYFVPTVRAQ